jgi:hypothetical protein
VATVTVNPQPTAGTDGSIMICETSMAVIVPSNLITKNKLVEFGKNRWIRRTFDAAAGTLTQLAQLATFSYTLTARTMYN